MADNFIANAGAGGDTFGADDVGGVKYPRSKIGFGIDGTYTDVAVGAELPIALSAAQITALQPLATQPVSGTVTANTGLSQPLTDAQLRATPVPVSGTFFQGTQPISAAALPLPTGAATETTVAALNTKTPALGVAAPSAASPVVLANAVIVGAAASIAALNIDLLTGGASGWFDATNYRSVSIQIVGSAGITAGAITFEQTNDTTVAAAGNLWPVDEMAIATPTPIIAAVTIAANTIRSFGAPITHRFVRVRVSTAFATANVQAIANFSQATYWRQTHTVHQATAANLLATVSGTVTATVSGAGITGGVISPLTVAGVSVEASTAKTVTATGTTITNNSANGVLLFINASVVSGTTPTLVVRLQVQDPVSALWVDVPGAATASITAVSTTLLTVAAGVTPVANAAVSFPVPRTYRVAWVIGGTTPSFTFSVGAQYII